MASRTRKTDETYETCQTRVFVDHSACTRTQDLPQLVTQRSVGAIENIVQPFLDARPGLSLRFLALTARAGDPPRRGNSGTRADSHAGANHRSCQHAVPTHVRQSAEPHHEFVTVEYATSPAPESAALLGTQSS